MPLSTPTSRASGAVALVSLTAGEPGAAARRGRAGGARAPDRPDGAQPPARRARSRRNRQTLEGVICVEPHGVLVSDMRGRLSIANRAAAEILGLDLSSFVGRPLCEVVRRGHQVALHQPRGVRAARAGDPRRPEREAIADAETVDGRTVEHSSSPVRDRSRRAGGARGHPQRRHPGARRPDRGPPPGRGAGRAARARGAARPGGDGAEPGGAHDGLRADARRHARAPARPGLRPGPRLHEERRAGAPARRVRCPAWPPGASREESIKRLGDRGRRRAWCAG